MNPSKEQDENKNELDPNKKIPFTLRIERYLINRLEELAQKTSKAAVARNFLNLTTYINAKPDLSIETPDGTKLMMLPKSIVKNLFHSLKRDEQYEIGNELARIFNTNCTLRQITDLSEKIKYLKTIGWFDIELIPKQVNNKIVYYYGISAQNWPLHLLHAFLYRMIHIHQYPFGWNISEYVELLSMSQKKLEKEKRRLKNDVTFGKYPNMIEEFKEKLGGHVENFKDDCAYYLFDVLVTNNPE